MCMFDRGNDCAHVSTIVSITDRIFVIFVILYSLYNYIEHKCFKYIFFFILQLFALQSNRIDQINHVQQPHEP